MPKVVIINDNNNFAQSLFRSALHQKNTSAQKNNLRFHTMTSKKMLRSYYCLSKSYFLYESMLEWL